ncbi:hypothetical protein IV203_036845 [Nitzschia inconspicua]|uniref:Uncharacterized protein n=1 Tax=Nitzschia inconspicua TaxID=303405 RepID=A0A9K3LG17_9STRA|nr:hypothetical protein IV203_036845 [Nitzschia inconspicua]
MSFFGEMNGLAAHAEGSLFTFNNDYYDDDIALGEEAIVYSGQQLEQPSSQQFDYAQNQDPQRSPTRSPVQAVIAMASHTSLQQMSIWTPFALLRHRSRPNDNSTSINRAPDTAATQNPSKHMHSWTNPMAGMDLIQSERPKNSIMKVRRLQDSIDSKYPGGSGQATKQEAELQVVQHAKMSTADRFSRLCNPSYLFKLGCGTSVFVMCLVQYSMLDLRTRIFLTWFALVGTVFVWVILSPVAKKRALRRIVEESKQFERQWPERRRLRMPHFFVDLKNKPLFEGPKKNRWGAWKRDDPDNDSTRDSYLLFRDGRRNIRIVKRAAVLKVATEYKALNFVEKVGVKLIPLFSDEWNANAYLKDPGDMVKKNRVDEYQELLVGYWWRHTFTQSVLPGLNHHYRTLTFNWEVIAAQAVAAQLQAELANAPPPRKFKKVNMDKWMRDDWRWEDGLAPYIEEVSIQGREWDLDSRGAMVTTNDGSDGNNTVQDIITNDDDTPANDNLISLIDSDDIVPDSVSNVVPSETTNGDDDTTSTTDDDDSVQHSDKIPSVNGDENIDYAVSMNELVPSTTINGTFQDSIDEAITTHEDATDTNEEFSSAESNENNDDTAIINELVPSTGSDSTFQDEDTTANEDFPIWTPFALLRHRSRPNDSSISINRAPDTAATQNPSKHMHSWTNPMAGMDLIQSEQPQNSIMKVRRLQDSIDSKYPGRCDCKKTRETFTALSKIPAVQHDHKTSLPPEDCSERQRQRAPDIFISLREKPRFLGPKKSIWQAWERDEPHIDINKHGCILLRDVGGIVSILKWEAAMEDEIPYRKPLSFVHQVGVKFIPRRLDKCNASAYLRDLKESVKKNYSEVDEEVERRREWKHIYTRFALSGFDRHYSAITSQWRQPRAAAREEASTTNSSDIDDDSTTTNDLSSRIDSDDTVQVSGNDSSSNETTNEDDDSTTTDEDDRNVQHSDNNFFDHDEDSTTTQNELSPIDCDAATNIVITVNATTANETPSIGASSNTSRRRVPRPRRRTTIKSTEMEVDEATVWVNGRRRSSRLQPKTGSVWTNGRRTSARFL